MSKAILEFNLPEESEDHRMALNAVNDQIVLSDLDNFLRGKIKYAEESVPDSELSIYEQIRNKLRELAADHDVEI